MNLLSNSIKFTKSGYVLLLVRFDERTLHITVQDSGSGIPKAFLPQLFEPYKQVQQRGSEGGTGLGLNITKRLLHQMQGILTVESKYKDDQGVEADECGSVFNIALPIATPEASWDTSSFSLRAPVRVIIMHDGTSRNVKGLVTAWLSFGAEVSQQMTPNLAFDHTAIIWADLSFLRKHHDFYCDMLDKQVHLMLVPYNDRVLLEEILGPCHPRNILPVRKPLIWHHIVQAIINTRQARDTHSLHQPTKSLPKPRKAPRSANRGNGLPTKSKRRVVLLVEDNKVRNFPNQYH